MISFQDPILGTMTISTYEYYYKMVVHRFVALFMGENLSSSSSLLNARCWRPNRCCQSGAYCSVSQWLSEAALPTDLEEFWLAIWGNWPMQTSCFFRRLLPPCILYKKSKLSWSYRSVHLAQGMCSKEFWLYNIMWADLRIGPTSRIFKNLIAHNFWTVIAMHIIIIMLRASDLEQN